MRNTNITQARTNLFKLADRIIKFNDIVNIATKNGNVIMLSEEDYNGLLETVYLCNIPDMCESLIEAKETPAEKCELFDWRNELK